MFWKKKVPTDALNNKDKKHCLLVLNYNVFGTKGEYLKLLCGVLPPLKCHICGIVIILQALCVQQSTTEL